MKKRNTIIFYLVFFLFSGLHAQEKPSFGFQVGPTLSTQTRVVFYDVNPIVRVSSSINILYPVNKKLNFRIHLAYEKKGLKGETFYSLDSSATNIIDDFVPTTKYNYLTLPLLLERSFGKNVKFSIGAGTYVAYVVRIKDIIDYGNADRETLIRKDFSFINRVDIGLSGSANMMYPISDKLGININLLYNRGLVPIVKKEISPVSIYHSAASLLFGLNYTL